MKVILRTDIAKLGGMGEIKEVALGFARNYLIPRKLASEATANNLKIWERQKVGLAKKRNELIESSKIIAESIEKTVLTLKVKTGENGKLFGSVTIVNIVKALEEKGFTVDKHDITIAEPIKTVGEHVVDVRLHHEVTAKVKVNVVSENAETAAE